MGDWNLILWRISGKYYNAHASVLSPQRSRDMDYLFTKSYWPFVEGFSLGDFSSLALLLCCLQEKDTFGSWNNGEQPEVVQIGHSRFSDILHHFSIIIIYNFYILLCTFFQRWVLSLFILLNISKFIVNSLQFPCWSPYCLQFVLHWFSQEVLIAMIFPEL